MGNPLRLLDAARSIVDEINSLLDAPGKKLLYCLQLRASAGSITANIREAYGRREGAERNQFLRFARASAEESDEHLSGNFRSKRLASVNYWRLHNRIAVVVKMLNALMRE